MNKKTIIAILADFPLWIVDENLGSKHWHAPSWVEVMYHEFSKQEEFEIHWFAFSKKVCFTRRFISNGQYFHVMPRPSLNLAEKTGFIMDRWLVKRELKRVQPDIAHAWGTEMPQALCFRDFPGKKILSIQGLLTVCCARSPMGSYMQKMAKIERDCLPAYDVITAESDWAVEQLRQIYTPGKYLKWEYAPAGEYFNVVRNPAQQPVCMVAGQDYFLKNVDLAVRAFSRPELSHVQLLLAGTSPARRPNLPPNIKALGGLPREKMMELQSRIWCLIHPSLADTGPTIVKEARVVGVPAIVSSECGGKQYVAEGESGFIIEPHDEDGLVRAVLAVCADRETSLRMGTYGQAECRHLLSPETMCTRLKAIYDEMLNRK